MRLSKKGFTLAEVLITLMIIGIIASLTIPGLVQNTQEAEYNVAVKKIYSDLSNAVMMIQINNNGFVKVGIGNGSTQITAFRNDFCNVMSCVTKNTATNIFGGTNYKLYKAGDNGTLNSIVDDSATINNGVLLKFYSYPTCDSITTLCGDIKADINGRKGPNMWGKDLFSFYVSRESVNNNITYSIIPGGLQKESGIPSNIVLCTVGTGFGCAKTRLYDPDHMP
ncbi:MAG: prepilin-type N-terminal cleavage/methylation domain-containing protein [Candidatus Gastranaerophilales bacterium]|nr:prepilin-type N-terminal cleavage/methylation domain-containing protein [Candidatus Gastranaerophilales bacterium]